MANLGEIIPLLRPGGSPGGQIPIFKLIQGVRVPSYFGRSRLIPPLLKAPQLRMNRRPGLDMQVLRKCQAFFPLPLSAFRLRIDGWRRPFGNQNGVTTVVRPLVRTGNHQPCPLMRSDTPGTCCGCELPSPDRADARGWRACAPS